MPSIKPTSWKDVKSVLENLPPKKLVSLIGELYRHSEANRNFISTRFSSASADMSERLSTYKKIIKESLYPDMYGSSDVEIRLAKKAISDYTKASKDEDGTIELMLYFLEVGTDVTDTFGDLWEGFYDSMISMGDRIAEKLEKRNDAALTDQLHPRFERLVGLAGHFGWGYGDYLRELYQRLYEYVNTPQVTDSDRR